MSDSVQQSTPRASEEEVVAKGDGDESTPQSPTRRRGSDVLATVFRFKPVPKTQTLPTELVTKENAEQVYAKLNAQ